MPKKKTTLPKNFCELCQAGDIAALQAIYADTNINATERNGGKMHSLAMRATPPAFMQWLIDHGADPNFQRTADDSPPLYHQVQAGNAEHAAVLTMKKCATQTCAAALQIFEGTKAFWH